MSEAMRDEYGVQKMESQPSIYGTLRNSTR